jgi:solute carrier family 25 citrate transporter 1
MDSRRVSFKNPFPRPWMENSGAAAAAGGGSSVGLKGIIAGK